MKAAPLLTAAAGLLILSACSRQAEQDVGSATNMSTNQVAEKLDSVKLEPGEWEATQEIVDVQLNGLPQGVSQDAVTRMIGQRTSFRHCVTPEQAAKPSADFLSAQKDANCTYSNLEMENGQVSANMTCAVPQQDKGRMEIAMDGRYLPDSYDIDMNVNTTGLANGLSMTMKMKSSGRRVGDCDSTGDTGGTGDTTGDTAAGG